MRRGQDAEKITRNKMALARRKCPGFDIYPRRIVKENLFLFTLL